MSSVAEAQSTSITSSGARGDSWRLARDVARAAATPTTCLLLVCVAVVAGWSSRALTLPRPVGVWVGPILVAASWLLLDALLVLACALVVPASPDVVRRLVQRVPVATILGLVSTEALRIAIAPWLEPLGWPFFHYLRLFIPLALTALWCAALLPRETREVMRIVRRPKLAALVALVALLVVAALLVSASDLAFQLIDSGSAAQRQIALDLIAPKPWVTTSMIVFLVLALVLAVTSSTTATTILVVPVFAAMVFATLAKFRYLHSAVQPLDVLTLPEFMPLFASFFGTVALMASVAGLALWLVAFVVAIRHARTPLSWRVRGAVGAVSLILLTVLLGLFVPTTRLPAPLAAHSAAVRALRVGLGAPSGPFRETARSHGIVLTFLSEIRSVFVTAPPGYSAAAVERVRRSYEPTGPTPRARSGGVSLVIYLVESLMDPNDLGLRYTSEPMPNFRSIAAGQIHGRAVVPFEYYGSAETEFELLTGMSMAFLPAGSIPFRQYVRRPLPALPRMLHDLGYATIAVQAGPRTFYDRERVEPLLGFDRTIWPYGAPGVARADRGRWPSDDVIVDSVIAASEGPRPFFIFAFPASMHSPYHSGTYARADLDVRDAPTPAAAAEVKEYINAVRVADRAIGHLVEHFRGARDSVVIAIMGDHLPPFSSDVLALFTRRLARLPTAARARATRATPMLVWANFSLPPGEITLSTNMLPGYLLERVGAPGRELFALTDSLRRVLPVTSAVAEANDGRLWLIDSVPPPLRRALADYRVLQYDILLGRRFSQGWKTLAASAAPPTTP